ncbi:conjugal transfer protein TrbB [Campylobacter fetus subsp. venerealis cfvi92/203]|uniref:P-type conjugative transfer ATPase TrbB n=1 Tax=Campylobacter fetus TaxID=196 RepID=UPI0008189898|nr:P-type conjugative transfer ATPase TrbB [Campylobacter fetus]OCS39193.1 conjugal transfer protein TrbB [Campylobacter fetus subsp. venerealis cfvi92/203]
MNTEFQERIITKIRREFGDEIINILNDDKTIELMLNSDGKLWVEKLGSDMECWGNFPESKAKSIINSVASFLDTTANSDNPILECELPIDGSRFEALLPPVVSTPTFTIRKKAIKIFTLEDYQNSNILSQNQKNIIENAITTRQNILVVGGTGSGKTTFCNAIIDGMSRLTPDNRIIIIEDTAELQCSSRNKVILRSTDKVSMLRLLKATMRLRPDRIVVGETRGKEALDLLKAWNTGHPGGIATIHANSAYGGLTRLEQLISEATSAPMSELISEAVNLVVFIQKIKGGRKIQEIMQVKGFDKSKNQYITQQI